MKKAIVSLSGGMDSAVSLAQAFSEGYAVVRAVGFCYGSKHNQYENDCAKILALHYNVPFSLVDLSVAMQDFKSALLLEGGEIPEGHYEHESMGATVVPCRNLIFASLLSGLALSLGAERVFLGIHSGDHAIYPDCRPAFLGKLNETLEVATEGKVAADAPFLYCDKGDIVARGLRLGVPFEKTRTCYKNQPIACGKCGSCRERLEAFSKNNAQDPIQYE